MAPPSGHNEEQSHKVPMLPGLLWAKEDWTGAGTWVQDKFADMEESLQRKQNTGSN